MVQRTIAIAAKKGAVAAAAPPSRTLVPRPLRRPPSDVAAVDRGVVAAVRPEDGEYLRAAAEDEDEVNAAAERKGGVDGESDGAAERHLDPQPQKKPRPDQSKEMRNGPL